MAQTTPPTITPSPAAPQRGNKATFSGLVDAFVAWLVTAVSQFGAVATNVYNNAVDAFNSATAAAGSANTASIQAAAAVSGVNAAAWISGTSYTAGQARYSPVDFRTYRRMTNGAGTIDPSLDPANWRLISDRGIAPMLHVREEQPSGTSSIQTVVGMQNRVLNTVKVNTIVGASLGGSLITLPSGTYSYEIRMPINGNGTFKGFLYNVTDTTYDGIGAQTYSINEGSYVMVRGRIEITSTKVFAVRINCNVAGAGLGIPASTGYSEVYSEAVFIKEA